MKKRMLKRLLPVSLSLMLAAAALPMHVMATEPEANSRIATLIENGVETETEKQTETQKADSPKMGVAKAVFNMTATVAEFESPAYGYTRPEAEDIVIKNEESTPMSITGITLEGANKADFSLNKLDLEQNNNLITVNPADPGNPNSNIYRKATIQPKAGLDAGEYTVNIVIDVTDGALTEKITKTVKFVVAKVVLVPEIDSVESKTYDGEKDAEGTLTLNAEKDANKAIVNTEKPAATGKFKFVSADVGTDKKVSVSDIALASKWKTNYELKKTSLDSVKTTAKITKATQTKTPKKIKVKNYYYNSITVKVVKGQEYSIDNGENWDTTGKFSSLSANTEYTITTRIAATDNYKASTKSSWKTEKVTTSRAPIISSVTNNTISNISANTTYRINTTLSFGAKGAGMDIASPSLDDVRYIPVSWKVATSSGTWAAPTSATNSASFSISTAGTYTLEVTFKKQVHNGSDWTDTSITDIKSVTFMTSSTGSTQSGNTGSNGSSTTNNSSNVAKTGDNSPIIILCVLLLLSVGVIIVYFVKRKKTK